MITLKESILSRSSHSGEGFKTQRIEMIEKWLKEYKIKNYTINDDFTIDVKGNVNLFRRDLVELPDYIQFGVVRGDFHCGSNNLTSLRGVPREVGGSFNCSINKLTSLEGTPEKVGNVFNCSGNKLTSLKGSPKEVEGNFNCSVNELTSLIGAPKEVRGSFYCSYNKVSFTEDDVRRVCEVEDEIII